MSSMATTDLDTRAQPQAIPAIRGLWWKGLTGLLMTAGILAAFVAVGPMPGAFSMHGHGAKVIFFHVPCAWLASLAYVVGAWYSVQALLYKGGRTKVNAPSWLTRACWAVLVPLAVAIGLGIAGGLTGLFLLFGAATISVVASLVTIAIVPAAILAWVGRPPSAESDHKACAAMELGLLFSVLTTITGSIFSQNEWGKYWSWDPRQTSIVIILLIFAAYVVLRGSLADPERRARLSAAYALVAIVPGLFLIWVLPRIVETLHENPNKTLVGGQIGGNYRRVMYGMILPAYLGTFVWTLQLRTRTLRLVAQEEVVA